MKKLTLCFIVLISLSLLYRILTVKAEIVIQGNERIYQQNNKITSAPAKATNNPDIWANYPELKRICSCESWGSPNKEPRQFRDGKPLWSDAGTPDAGACQINLPSWQEEIDRLELDVINSFEDNVKLAKYIYDRKGSQPWNQSRGCWDG